MLQQLLIPLHIINVAFIIDVFSGIIILLLSIVMLLLLKRSDSLLCIVEAVVVILLHLLHLAVLLFLELPGQLHVLVHDLLLSIPLRHLSTSTVVNLTLHHHRQLVIRQESPFLFSSHLYRALHGDYGGFVVVRRTQRSEALGVFHLLEQRFIRNLQKCVIEVDRSRIFRLVLFGTASLFHLFLWILLL